MLEKAHEHIVSELQQGARTDTIFIVTAVLFNLIVLAVNSIVAGEASAGNDSSTSGDLVLTVFIIMLIIVNGIALAALNVGKQTRNKLSVGVISMYEDQNVAKYYDSSLLANYNSRYRFFSGIILCLAVTAIIVPLIIRFS